MARYITPATANDWYWLKADGKTLFSTAAGGLVPIASPAYAAWLAAGNQASQWPRDDSPGPTLEETGQETAAALDEVLAAYGLSSGLAAVTVAQLQAHAADRRYAVETAGILVNGAKVATDRESQSMIGNAFTYVQVSGAATVRFKASSGWVTLPADQLKVLALAVGAHVQAAFAVEDDLDAAITATPPTITTFAQIDAAAWPATAG